jgi:threonine dehydratase
MTFPTRKEIEIAAERIQPAIHHTPIYTSQAINMIAGCELFFKCENFQKVGAFKFRGASNAIAQIPKKEIANGVATHSSGNHAQALALAAKNKGCRAYIVMPNNAPKIKKEAVIGYGAKVIECAPTLAARETTLKKVVEETSATFIHPYNDKSIIVGQATCAKEVFEEFSGLDYMIAPVGGGGLLSGTALSTHYFSPDTQVIGAEPKGADDAYQSLYQNKIIPSTNPNTIADGLLTSLGDKTFPIIKEFVEDILLVDDLSIIQAMKLIWQRMKIVVEPSAAVPLAAILNNRIRFKNSKIAIILSGGNVDFE